MGHSTGVTQAATFPVPTLVPNAAAPNNSLDDNRFQMNIISNPNLRQSYQELVSPTDLSARGTPDSSSTGKSMQRPQYSLPQLGVNNGLPDLSAMMFPSADPFAYPNQPMMEFDNIKQENIGNINSGPRAPPMYLSNGASGAGVYDDLEGQLFGPIPPYLMQGQQQFDVTGQLDTGGGMMSGLPQEMNYQAGVGANGDVNFDGIFGDDEWSNIVADQRFR